MNTPIIPVEPPSDRAASPAPSAPATMRDDLLRWLLRFPLLRVEEIAFLAGVSRSRAYARLSALQDQGLIT
ncbi:MAG: helix-turn-helix domain-containing protein, partial [Ktedonobacterales bacterium]